MNIKIGISTFMAYPRKATLIDQVIIIIFRKANTLNVTPEMKLVTINSFIFFLDFNFTYTTIAFDGSRVSLDLATKQEEQNHVARILGVKMQYAT